MTRRLKHAILWPFSGCLLAGLLAVSCCANAAAASADDAYASTSADGQQWTIGTDAVELRLEYASGKLRLVALRNKLTSPATEYVAAGEASDLLPSGTPNWQLQGSAVRHIVYGGRPAVQLDVTLSEATLKVTYHIVAFPRTSIVRQWAELHNTGPGEIALTGRDGRLSINLRSADKGPFTACWMTGANNQRLTAGVLHRESIGPTYRKELTGAGTYELTPWLAIHRDGGASDGLFVALDSVFERWTLALDRSPSQPGRISAGVPLKDIAPRLAPGASVVLPTVTLGVFNRDLDDMAARLYTWQYEYLWDYTHDDWFALMPWTIETWYGDTNLQQQFAGRLARSDADAVDLLRECGMELLWNDAGWAADQNIWAGNLNGPDYAESLRYCDKFGVKRVIWMPGNRTPEELDAKVGAWGDFQWRSDGVDTAAANGRQFRDTVAQFLDRHPRCSFHSCSGGATYAHTFDWQRFGDVHYDTDYPEPEFGNTFFSYLHLPDKWFDNLAACSATRRRMIAMVPKYHFCPTAEEKALLRRIADLYHYLLHTGVAGRWSLVAHPLVKGDAEGYYFQRISFDRKRALIVLKHDVKGRITIFPRGLLPEHDYLVEGGRQKPSTTRVSSVGPFCGQDVTRQEVLVDSNEPGVTRSGRDLMLGGITIENQPAGTYIYLNLPDRPAAGRDKTAPTAPGRVLSRRETNLGHTGVMLYWSPGGDNNWISCYEVRRGEQILGRTATGLAFFDRSAGWNAQAEYSVRTIDGDGNASEWTKATPIADEPLTYAALGALGPEAGRDGWRAEISADGRTYRPMTWIPRAGVPTAECGGNPNQRGGAEGYWEAAATARCGRGWQQASVSAMCVRTWVAPHAGPVRITGKAVKEFYHRNLGRPLNIRIMHGERQVWPATGWAAVPLNNLDGLAHDLTVNVKSGDPVRFILDKGTSPENDILAWMPRIVYVQQPVAEQATVVRILCGAKTPYRDKTGNIWSADTFYAGGRSVHSQAPVAAALPTAEDAELYRHGRSGEDFAYSVPVPPGLYSVRLKFAETEYDHFFERPFNLDVNGRRVLRNFDVCQTARGPHKAYDRVLRYLVPDKDGRIVLRFSTCWEPTMKSASAMSQAIEVLPELKPHVRINVGSDRDLVDWGGHVWIADSDHPDGKAIRSDAPIDRASPTLYDQHLYRTARSGRSLVYSVSVPPGLYTVHLKFAELWLKRPGERPMNIAINGNTTHRNWDPATAAGQLNTAADVRIADVTPDHNGKITIAVSATGANDAILQGIEIE
jgi:hypothetical protein